MKPEAERLRELETGLDAAIRARLEQLRFLENGYPIRVAETKLGAGAPCIETPQDLSHTREYLSKLQSANT